MLVCVRVRCRIKLILGDPGWDFCIVGLIKNLDGYKSVLGHHRTPLVP